MSDGIDTRRWNAITAGRAAEKFGESAADRLRSRPSVARLALTTSTGKPLEPGKHRFPSRMDGITNWSRIPV